MEPQVPVTPTQSKRSIARLVIGIIYFVLIGPGWLFALSSAFAMDAPGAAASPLTKLFVWTLQIFPFALLLAGVWAVATFIRPQLRQRTWLNRILLWLPIINIVVFVLVNLGIMFLCHGSFVCHPW